MTDIVAVNRGLKIALSDDGDVYPVTNWFDAFDAEECAPHEAGACVAGEGAIWFWINLLHFDFVSTH